MKNKTLFIIASILLLSSCTNITSNVTTGTATSVVTPVSETKKKILNVTLPTTLTYSQYDKFQTAGLKVLDEDNKEITDYNLQFDDSTTLNDGDYLLSDAGTYNINIVKEGYTAYNFSIKILESTKFKQEIKDKEYPTKKSYTLNSTEKIDLTGFNFVLKTSYKNNENRTKKYEETLKEDDFNIYLDDEDVTGKEVTFNTYGAHTVKLVYNKKGWINNEIENSTLTYSIYVKDTSKKPIEYVDNTITSTVSSTDTYEVSITKENSTKSEDSTDKGYYSPDEVDASFNIQSYGRNNVDNWVYTPSTGKVPFLVVPVIIPGYSGYDTADNLALIQKAFFGNSSDLNFESLHSYYYRSSYGQLDITGVVTDFFDLASYDSSFSSTSSITSTSTINIANDAAEWASTVQGYDLTDFDSDGDGLIDGMWLVYLAPSSSSSNSAFWAFSYTTGNSGNVSSPVVNNYGWAGINFLNDQYAGNGNYENAECDAHVLIHETGHMLGAYDYYSYSYNSYDPTGSCLMMSYNVGDHDLYTKMLFGWVTPYIVYDTSKLSIVASQAKKDQLIVIPYEGKTYTKDSNGKVKFNMFDEYIVLEYYTDDDLNSYDYDCYNVTSIKGKGIRMLHIDNRLGYNNSSSSYNPYYSNYNVTMFSDPDEVLTTTKKLIKPINNSESGQRSESSYYGLDSSYDAYDEIRVISKDKRVLSTNNTANTNTLFKSGDSFNINDYYAQFANSTTSSNTYTVKFNNGKSFPYTISF